jgi:hypothetical protein
MHNPKAKDDCKNKLYHSAMTDLISLESAMKREHQHWEENIGKTQPETH